ncbi:MAG: hypothetical protein NTX49_09750, partial [Chlamydiae bacterium]|nr:hypothetical protein [Chlamydiota bacterium]
MTNHPNEKGADERVLKEHIQLFINEMDVKYGLCCVGDGGRSREKIEIISLKLSTNRRASLEEAREIQVNAVERFLEILNTSERIKPYLLTHPFPRNDLKISIMFVSKITDISIMFVSKITDDFFADGTVCSTLNARDKIFYEIRDVFDTRFIDFFEEPYEEALQIVKSHPVPYDMRYHKEQGFENEIDKLCNNFVKKAHKKYGLQCDNFGGKMTDGIEEVAFTFVSRKKTSLEKARKMEVELTEMLLHDINSNQKIRPYLKQYPFTAKMTPTR